MSEDKVRAEFEGAAKREQGLDLTRLPHGGYRSFATHQAWWAWQASRAALSIDLPIEPSMSMYVSHREVRAALDMHARFRLAIASAGVRVKP